MSSDLERGVVHNSQHQPGIHTKKSTNSSTKQRASPKKLIDFSGQIRTAYHHFPYESLWYHPAAKTIPTVFSFFNVQEGRLNHRCRSRRWHPKSGVGCVIDQSHGGTRMHQVWFHWFNKLCVCYISCLYVLNGISLDTSRWWSQFFSFVDSTFFFSPERFPFWHMFVQWVGTVNW